MDAIRTFIAVDLSPAVCKRAGRLIDQLRLASPDVKWVEPHLLHVTLKFLGDVPSRETPTVCAAVAEAVADFAPLTIGCAGLGAFPDIRRARTIWLGVDEGQEALIELQHAVDRAMRKLRYPRETRRFHPHVTLGRVRRSGPGQQALQEQLTERADFRAGSCQIDEVRVYASYLERSGPTHDVMSRARLG